MTHDMQRLLAGLGRDASDADIMRVALAAARLSALSGEVPVGAVLVRRPSDEVPAAMTPPGAVSPEGSTLRWLACTHNQPIGRHDPTAHAEVLALRQAARALGNYRIDDCELFVTLEPCAMCAQAMLHARVKRVVWGAPEPRTGAAGSVLDLFAMPQLNHHTQVVGGVLADECGALLREFFAGRREAQRRLATPLRDDALRTPPARFEAARARWPALAHSARLWCDLPGLDGLCLHTIDLGPADAATVWLALHGPECWWPQWADWAQAQAAQGARVLLPDLIGFGQSDKPKKPQWHSGPRHAAALLAWLDALGVEQLQLAVAPGQEALASVLEAAAGPRLRSSQRVTDLPTLASDLAEAPFPDAGHRAGPRAWPGLQALKASA